MTSGHAEVDERLSLSLGIPRRDRIRAELQFERGGHSVVRQVPIASRILTVRVELYEARRDDESPDVDGVACRGYVGGHRRDASLFDPHGPNGVEVRLRVQHSAAREHDVEGGHRFPDDLASADSLVMASTSCSQTPVAFTPATRMGA